MFETEQGYRPHNNSNLMGCRWVKYILKTFLMGYRFSIIDLFYSTFTCSSINWISALYWRRAWLKRVWNMGVFVFRFSLMRCLWLRRFANYCLDKYDRKEYFKFWRILFVDERKGLLYYCIIILRKKVFIVFLWYKGFCFWLEG